MNDYEEIVKEYPRGRRMEYPNQSTSKEPAEESRADRSKEHHQSEFRSLIVETKMAISSLSLTFTSTTLPNQVHARNWRIAAEPPSSSCSNGIPNCSLTTCFDEQDKRSSRRTALVLGIGTLALNLIPSSPLLVEGKPENYEVFVDKTDGYTYYYPSDWREFDFLGHDSAFKDRYMQLQNVRLSFIPTLKTDIRELGPMDEVITNLVTNVYSAPTQVADILDMQERTIDGKSYYTFEYILTSPNFARAAFATIAIGNGRYYTLIVGANERRWRRYRNQLKVVADSFQVLDI